MRRYSINPKIIHESKDGEWVKYEDYEEVLNALQNMVHQHCYNEKRKVYDGYGLSANAFAIEVLAEHGLAKITGGWGRCIIAEPIFENK